MHKALRVPAFRAYATHMTSEAFQHDLQMMKNLACTKRVAYMCAETVWWKCHRRLISDRYRMTRNAFLDANSVRGVNIHFARRVLVDGWEVRHLGLGPLTTTAPKEEKEEAEKEEKEVVTASASTRTKTGKRKRGKEAEKEQAEPGKKKQKKDVTRHVLWVFGRVDVNGAIVYDKESET